MKKKEFLKNLIGLTVVSVNSLNQLVLSDGSTVEPTPLALVNAKEKSQKHDLDEKD